MRIVLSGPIKANDNYEADFAKIATELRVAGNPVFSPAELDAAKTAKTATQAEHQVALRRCVAEIAVADELVVLPGWQISKGARFEVFVAGELGIPIRFLEEL